MTPAGPESIPSRISLDTSAYSYLRRADPVLIDIVGRAEIVYICATVLGELDAAFRAGSRYAENRSALEAFLSEPFIGTIHIDGDVARRYGDIHAALRRAGTPIPTNDVWIAASTLDAGSHLVTYDADFSRIDTLPHTLLTG